MFWKSDKRMWTLKKRMVVLSLISGSVISLLAAAIILPVSYFHLTQTNRELIERLADDLREEYEKFGSGKAFFACMEDDASEHDPELTFLFLTEADGKKVYGTKTPSLIEERILSSIQRGARRRRMYLQRDKVRAEHVALWVAMRDLSDGRRVTVARDTTASERFFFFLSGALGGAFLLTTILATILSWIFGTRLTNRLNRIGETAQKIEAGDWAQRTEIKTHVKELHELAEMFNAMCEKNEKTLTELKMLTDNLAHDLRTPLTRLRMAAEANEEGDEALADVVIDETSEMLNLINVMLEISQTGATIDKLPREDLDLCEAVQETLDLFQPLAEQGGIMTAAKVPRGRVLFNGHKAKIQQVLGNLVENAIKYTGKGGRVEVALEEIRGENGEGVKIEVTDTGCGIAAADLPHVFQRFWRADVSRHLPGNGLGLALVKAIATSYGGVVTCRSKVGVGTTFTVILPTTGQNMV